MNESNFESIFTIFDEKPPFCLFCESVEFVLIESYFELLNQILNESFFGKIQTLN